MPIPPKINYSVVSIKDRISTVTVEQQLTMKLSEMADAKEALAASIERRSPELIRAQWDTNG
jgi:hypothetical protein